MMMGETLGRSGQSIEGPEWQNLWQISVPKKCCVPHGSTYFLRSYLTDLTHQIGPQRHPEKILGSIGCCSYTDVGIACPMPRLESPTFMVTASSQIL